MIIGWPGENLILNATMTGMTGSTTPDTGYTATDVRTYDTAQTVKWSTVGAGTINIDFDRGASVATSDPVAVWITNWLDSSYNYRTGASNVTTVKVQSDSVNTFASPTTLATISHGSPTYGLRTFGLPNLFSEFSALTERYVRIEIVTSGTASITIGNIFMSAVTDSVAGGWGFAHEWEIAQIDRGRKTEQEGGGMAVLSRDSIRRVSGTVKVGQPVFDKFLDMVSGRNTALVDSTAYPLAIAFDEDNQARAVTGQHYFSGLWQYEGNPTARGGSALFNTAIRFNPDVNMTFREWK